MKCPRCKMGSIEWVPWKTKDYEVVAVCRHIRRCGLRIPIPKLHSKTIKNREDFVEKDWRSGS